MMSSGSFGQHHFVSFVVLTRPRPGRQTSRMNTTPEIHRLANSITDLVTAVTEIIDAKVRAANTTEGRPDSPAAANEVQGIPENEPVAQETFIGFQELCRRVPLCGRSLREHVRYGRIPSIRLPGSRRFVFHWGSVQAALLRLQRGGARS